MSITNLSRRNFFQAAGTLVLGAALPTRAVSPAAKPTSAWEPSLFLGIDPDGTVTITSHRSEMGQGIRTAIAQVVADELDADWSRVRVAQAQGDQKYGDQNTDGSRSILMNYDRLRDAGASARLMLRQAAADAWGVSVDDVVAENHRIKHSGSGKDVDYGEFVADAAALPVPSNPTRKTTAEHKFIGTGQVHVDTSDIVHGEGSFGADVRLPNMAVAVLVRCPWLGGGVASFKEPADTSGVIGFEVLDAPQGAPQFRPVGGIAVIAEDTYTALRAANDLEIEWTSSPTQSFSSDTFREALHDALQSPGDQLFDIGNVDAAFDSAGKSLEATYQTPFLGHAPMEPPVAIADVKDGQCEVWAPVQDPQSTRGLVAQWLQTDLTNVAINATLLGGAFGRKSKPDFVIEAVELSKRLKRPVRVQWTREDDVQHDFYHAASAQFHRAVLDDEGRPTAWLQRTAFPSITTVFADQASKPADWELEMGFSNLPYRVENQRMESTGIRSGVRIGWMRSVCNIFHSFSANVFADEMASAAERDPIEHRLDILSDGKSPFPVPGMQAPEGHSMDIARLRHVIERVRDVSEWDRPRGEGVGLGFAVHHSFRSYVATVIEATMENGRPKVSNAYVALDCGTYVNADTCRAQMEGAVMFGLSLALHGDITMKDGAVEQSNFHDYPMLRMNEAPNVVVELIPANDNLPAGVGEPGVPPIAPALVNALFSATGTRHRSLPIKA